MALNGEIDTKTEYYHTRRKCDIKCNQDGRTAKENRRNRKDIK